MRQKLSILLSGVAQQIPPTTRASLINRSNFIVHRPSVWAVDGPRQKPLIRQSCVAEDPESFQTQSLSGSFPEQAVSINNTPNGPSRSRYCLAFQWTVIAPRRRGHHHSLIAPVTAPPAQHGGFSSARHRSYSSWQEQGDQLPARPNVPVRSCSR